MDYDLSMNEDVWVWVGVGVGASRYLLLDASLRMARSGRNVLGFVAVPVGVGSSVLLRCW